MSIEQEKQWITGEEIAREWRRLEREKVPRDSPKYQEFLGRIMERDDYLFDRYGKQYMETHPDKWIAITPDGQVLIRDTAWELAWDGRDAFGAGNFTSRRLSEFPGRKL